MAWIEYNPNPRRNRVGDCAIRAIAKATDQDWEMAYTGLYVKGYASHKSTAICWRYQKAKGITKEGSTRLKVLSFFTTTKSKTFITFL